MDETRGDTVMGDIVGVEDSIPERKLRSDAKLDATSSYNLRAGDRRRDDQEDQLPQCAPASPRRHYSK
eukprot:1410513-Rhodomonas_salina.1